MTRKKAKFTEYHLMTSTICVFLVLLFICYQSQLHRFAMGIVYDFQFYVNSTSTPAVGADCFRLPAVCARRSIKADRRITSEDVSVCQTYCPSYTKKNRFYFAEDVVGRIASRDIGSTAVIKPNDLR